MALFWPPKDPNETLDYRIDWSDRLGLDDVISFSVWITPNGITEVSNTKSNTTATIWLSGGSVANTYTFQNRINTEDGRIMDQTVYIKVQTR